MRRRGRESIWLKSVWFVLCDCSEMAWSGLASSRNGCDNRTRFAVLQANFTVCSYPHMWILMVL